MPKLVCNYESFEGGGLVNGVFYFGIVGKSDGNYMQRCWVN